MTFEEKTAADVPAVGVDTEVLEVGEFEDVAAPQGPMLGELTEHGWLPPGTMEYLQWAQEGVRLRAAHHGLLWAVGDWLNYGERKYGEKYVQAAEATGYTNGFLRNCKWIAGRFPYKCHFRNDGSFSHLYQVASLSDDHALRFLNLARDNEWSVTQLRTAIKEWREEAAAIENGAQLDPQPLLGCVSLGIAAGESDVKEAIREDKQERTEKRREKKQDDRERVASVRPAPGRYRALVVDPPWDYGSLSLAGRAAPTYAVMTHDELMALDVASWADDQCHLYLWTTNNFLPRAVALMLTWGFEHKTVLTWVKPRIGMGSYFRNTTEHALFGIRGGLGTLSDSLPTHFEAPMGEHSEKPEAFYELVREASHAPFGEVFQQRERADFKNVFEPVSC